MSDASKDSNHTGSRHRGITGVILAGGKSSRYGKNKAFEEVDGIPLIQRVMTVMGLAFERIILITNTPSAYAHLRLPMYKDRIKGLGPLGGIHTGLEAMPDKAGFFVACDMPFLNIRLVHHMVELWDDFDAVVPRVDWKLEPLHALYGKQCLPPIRELIRAGEYQILRFFHKIRVRYVDQAEIRTFDPQFRSFFNVNRPEELVEAKKS